MPPQFYISGSWVNRPETLRRLPLELYRSQDYPGQPDMMENASERFLAGDPPPIYVPAGMMYTRWTRKRDIFGANTVAMLAALKEARDVQEGLQAGALAQAGNVPVGQDFYESADHITGSKLPTLQRLNEQDYERTPLARNAIPISGFVDADAASAALGLQGVRGCGSCGTRGMRGLRGATVDSRWLVPVIFGGAAIFLMWASTQEGRRR